MTRRAHPAETLAMHSAREDARNLMTDLFPRALIAINIGRVGDSLGLTAHFADPTPHHEASDIVECLADMGVRDATMVAPEVLQARI
jgi:hypothetical protein